MCIYLDNIVYYRHIYILYIFYIYIYMSVIYEIMDRLCKQLSVLRNT